MGYLNGVERVDSGDSILGRVVQRCREQDANTSQQNYDQRKNLEKPTQGHLPLLGRVTGSYPGLLIQCRGQANVATKCHVFKETKCSKAVFHLLMLAPLL